METGELKVRLRDDDAGCADLGLSTRSLFFFQTSKGEHHLGSVYFLHSLHVERTRPCTQNEPPPHSLHRVRRRPWGQPLHTLHCDRYFSPCSHGPFAGGALFRLSLIHI